MNELYLQVKDYVFNLSPGDFKLLCNMVDARRVEDRRKHKEELTKLCAEINSRLKQLFDKLEENDSIDCDINDDLVYVFTADDFNCEFRLDENKKPVTTIAK